MVTYIIDRFEEGYAVCENYNENEDDEIITKNIEIKLIPDNANEGDIIVVSDDGKINIDYEKTRNRKEKMEELRKKLTKNKEN